jgi:predicted unusual protein kinase regulating ubiquinone biosynthesis (AarF/ABC1/UbiB family)
MRNVIRKSEENMKMTLIDAGMVIQLQEKDKDNFVNFVKFVIQSEGNKCADMIYNLSNYGGKKIKKGQFKGYEKALKEVFSKLDNKDLDELEGMSLLTGMLDTIRDNSMKLDG